jgi:hypothetical protein
VLLADQHPSMSMRKLHRVPRSVVIVAPNVEGARAHYRAPSVWTGY